MRICRLTLRDWMAFAGDHDLLLPEGAIAVVARYETNPRRSNWAGKTALLEAVEWCLFGVHRKRYEDGVIFRGADRVEVELAFSDGTVVTRSRDRGKATFLKAVAADGTFTKKAAEDRVRRLVGFDAADYRATVCYAQGDTEAIVERTSGERRKVVGQWLELDAWLRVQARARAHTRDLSERAAAVRAELAVRRGDLEGVDEESLEADIEGSRSELEEARRELGEVEARLESVALAEIDRQDRVRLAKLNEDRAALREDLRGRGLLSEAMDRARADHASTRAVLDATEAEMTAAQDLAGGSFDGVCPVTCKSCPVADEIRADRAAGEERLAEARRSRQEARKAEETARATLRDLEAQERELGRLRERYNALTAEAKRLHEAIEERAGSLADLDDAEVERLRARRLELREAERQAFADLREAEGEKAALADARVWVEKHAAEVDRIEAEMRAANLATKAVGPTGIPAAIAEAALHVLEERANALLAGTGLSFVFAWDRATKGLTPSCDDCGYAFRGQRDKECPACGASRGPKRADELEILVEDGSGEVEDVKAKSGGAKVLVASAIRLAAGLMLRERRDARCAWASVDEPFGSLDAENREVLARSFAGMLGSVGLEQAFVVSHDAALLDALPGRIEITRRGDRSTAEVVA